jgi:hypothetical protein
MTVSDHQRGASFVAVLMAMLIAVLLYFGYFKFQSMMSDARTGQTAIDQSRAFACRMNRQTIERGINMWQVNHPGEQPTLGDLASEGITASCPEGGTYELVGREVHCSVHD